MVLATYLSLFASPLSGGGPWRPDDGVDLDMDHVLKRASYAYGHFYLGNNEPTLITRLQWWDEMVSDCQNINLVSYFSPLSRPDPRDTITVIDFLRTESPALSKTAYVNIQNRKRK